MSRVVKKVLVLGFFGFSLNAFATSPVLPTTIVDLPTINNVSIEMKDDGICPPGMICPQVQPNTVIHFTSVSCARLPFEIETVALNSDFIPTIGIKVGFSAPVHDCMGPTFPHQYTLQVSSDASSSYRYQVLNTIGAVPTL